MPTLVRTRLSAMMFVFYFSLGAWAVTLSTFLMSAPTRGGLNFTTAEVGWVYSTFAIAGVVAPLFVGLLADRLFPAQRVLGVAGVVACGLLVAAGSWCDDSLPRMGAAYHAATARGLDADQANDDPAVRAVAADTFRTLFALMLGVCFCVQIGLTLSAVMCLRNLPDPARQFSRTRMWGTVGWIVAGNAVALLLNPVSAQTLYLAGGAAGAFGVFALTLPHTPPKGTGKTVAEAFGVPALKLLRDRSFCVFLAVAFASSVTNQFYGVYAHRYLTDLAVPRPEMVLTLGQWVEVGCMFAIPLLDPRRRMRWLMVWALVGWVARGAALVSGWVPAVVLVGVPMHGWSYAFFFIVAATYIDREAPPHLRASAQAIASFVASGLGPWAGNMLAAWVVDAHRVGTAIDWPLVWRVPMIGSTAALVAFVFLFKPPPAQQTG